MDSVYDDRGLLCRIAPFGYLWIIVCLRLPKAFRSLPRPSSAPDAKAFALRPYSLDLDYALLIISILIQHLKSFVVFFTQLVP